MILKLSQTLLSWWNIQTCWRVLNIAIVYKTFFWKGAQSSKEIQLINRADE